jgi:hypothetical protein
MKSSVSPPLTYFPVYLGLFASLVLAAACNAFLDIQYGSFAVEVSLWALIFGFTLWVGWRQRGNLTDAGKRNQKRVLILGAILTVLIFIPVWGFPRAGVAILAMVRAAQNCVTVSRRQLHLGLLVSAVMVMFAATHYRADWTMLFYLVPYLIAAVFTLVAEQINQSAQVSRSQSLAQSMMGGQGAAIAAATSAILLLAVLLYALTPQLSAPYLQWRYGQISSLVWLGKGQETGATQGKTGAGQGQTGGNKGNGDSSGRQLLLGRGWLSPAEMRQAAKRPGMPEWQRSAINKMADAREWTDRFLKPVKQTLREQWQSLNDWALQHFRDIVKLISVMAILALLLALWRLLREARAGMWMATRFDYLRLVWLGRHAKGGEGAHQFYRAMERLFKLHDIERSGLRNTREYLAQLRSYHACPSDEAAELTRLFEDSRYGPTAAGREQLLRMRELYRRLFLTAL